MIYGWKHLGFWNQFGLIVGITGTLVGIIGTIAGIASLAGMKLDMPTFNWIIPTIGWIALIFFCGFWLLAYANIKQSRRLTNANDELNKVPSKIDQAERAVYRDRDGKLADAQTSIDSLKSEVATWKDKASNYQTRASTWKEERDKFEATTKEFQSAAQNEHDRVEKLQKALDSMDMYHKKKLGITEQSIAVGMTTSIVADGSPKHLQGMEQKDLYKRAQKLAKEAGYDILDQPDESSGKSESTMPPSPDYVGIPSQQ